MKITVRNIGKGELTDLVEEISQSVPDVSGHRLGDNRCEIIMNNVSEKTVIMVRELIQRSHETEDDSMEDDSCV